MCVGGYVYVQWVSDRIRLLIPLKKWAKPSYKLYTDIVKINIPVKVDSEI